MQLVAYGAQDIYLTGNPQITFFKVVYRRHTNFSMEAIEQTMNGSTTVTSDNQTATCTISRNGDLIHKVYVTTDSVAKSGCPSWEGSKLIKEVELEIGGQRIDRHYTEWNQVWEELCTDESKAVGLKAMKGDIGTRSNVITDSTGVRSVQLPLNFWFCRNVGLALPLIALQYHEVKLKFTWGLPGETDSESSPSYACNVVVDYIYLDTDERRRFAQVSHEYLIEQIQKYEVSATSVASVSANLNFNHPVKELIWTNESVIEQMNAASDITTVQLKLNGHDRFSEKKLEYFQLRQPYEYHSAVPRQNLPSAAQLTSNYVDFSTDTVGTDLTSDVNAGVHFGATVFAIGALGAAALTNSSCTVNSASAITRVNGDTAGAQTLVALTATVSANFVVGRTYEITAYGPSWVGGAATAADTAGKTLITRVTRIVDGQSSADTGVTIDNANTAVQFDRLLLSAAADAASDVVITSIREVKPNSSLITQARTSKMTRKINVYSFGLKPEEHQPSGTCNFSRIDSAKLEFKKLQSSVTGGLIQIYAVNYNVLRIMSGMGGLAYSN